MSALATMPFMAKQAAGDKHASGGSVNVQGRLTLAEVSDLDAAAGEQEIPVTRAALVSHILREWLRRRREGKAKGR